MLGRSPGIRCHIAAQRSCIPQLPRRRRRKRAGLALAVATVAATGCAADDETGDTLAPLPVPSVVATTIAPTTVVAPPTIAPSTVETTVADQPVGEWDGARFDAGRIQDVDEDDIYTSIDLDRVSFLDPELGFLVDAAGFAEEPIAYWWTEESPYQNNQPNTREFVLTPNVELLVLGEDGEERACGEPPPIAVPEPVWEGVDISFLRTGEASRSVALLTYAPNGAVTRVRFTRGCGG